MRLEIVALDLGFRGFRNFALWSHCTSGGKVWDELTQLPSNSSASWRLVMQYISIHHDACERHKIKNCATLSLRYSGLFRHWMLLMQCSSDSSSSLGPRNWNSDTSDERSASAARIFAFPHSQLQHFSMAKPRRKKEKDDNEKIRQTYQTCFALPVKRDNNANLTLAGDRLARCLQHFLTNSQWFEVDGDLSRNRAEGYSWGNLRQAMACESLLQI